jgi:(1->4)-alpha-D-glucan 1-alpha-D-glucosylmutase
MMNIDRLRELACACGMELAYTDIWGREQQASPETLHALLATMGVQASDDRQVRQALAARLSQEWEAVLAPVLVCPAAEAPEIPVVLPAAGGARPLVWSLALEEGQQLAGRVDAGGLRETARGSYGGEERVRFAFSLPHPLPQGQHALTVLDDDSEPLAPPMRLIVVPPRCHLPRRLEGHGRVWGIAVQLYGVRSRRNWGMGDFGDLLNLIDLAADIGADVVGVNPLHALFPSRPQQASPYSPSHRSFVNPLYLDVEAMDDCTESALAHGRLANSHFSSRLEDLRARELVDYVGVAAAKWPMLEACYASFCERHLTRESERAAAFRAWRDERGDELRRFALHEALHEHFLARKPDAWGWPVWPDAYRTPESEAVHAFERARIDRVEFHEYLQWQCDLQLARVTARAHERGLTVGLYVDMAVGADRGGAETWARQDAFALKASAGAPPDEYNVNGQDWGLPPFSPHALAAAAYRPFGLTLAASMRRAGAVRVDHVMGLQRLFWVPPQFKASAGAYVHYPFADLLGLLVLESRQHHCLVVGEDLGTVAASLRTALRRADVLSYRPLYFEKNEDGSFRRPQEYPPLALASLGTHDLPTLRGYWEERDLRWRRQLSLYPTHEIEAAQFAARAGDRAALVRALRREGLLPGDPEEPVEWSPDLTLAAYGFLARTPCRIVLVQPEDVFGEAEQANLPGTVDEHPNWKRKLSVALEKWREHALLRELAATMNAQRHHASPPGSARR